MNPNLKTPSPLDLPDRIRAIADRLDEAFCASANTPECRALQPLDLLVMMDGLSEIADEVDANNEVMVRVASAYEACKASFLSRPSFERSGACLHEGKAKPRLSIVTTAVLVSSAGDVA